MSQNRYWYRTKCQSIGQYGICIVSIWKTGIGPSLSTALAWRGWCIKRGMPEAQVVYGGKTKITQPFSGAKVQIFDKFSKFFLWEIFEWTTGTSDSVDHEWSISRIYWQIQKAEPHYLGLDLTPRMKRNHCLLRGNISRCISGNKRKKPFSLEVHFGFMYYSFRFMFGYF